MTENANNLLKVRVLKVKVQFPHALQYLNTLCILHQLCIVVELQYCM